jgi:hypothetical protein
MKPNWLIEGLDLGTVFHKVRGNGIAGRASTGEYGVVHSLRDDHRHRSQARVGSIEEPPDRRVVEKTMCFDHWHTETTARQISAVNTHAQP